MSYLLNTPQDQEAMLAAIGVASIDDLFEVVPDELKLGRPLAIPPALTELELQRHVQQLARQNASAADKVCFLGGGSYDHFIPAAVDALASRGEFYTSYTPYQPEVAQGNLQAMFEYQTLICELTGMDVSNASLYDGGTATAEAALMAISATHRSGKVVASAGVHPEYRRILRTYFAELDTTLVTVDAPGGRSTRDEWAAAIDSDTACAVIQHPNFFGALDDVPAVARLVHDAGGLLVVICDPLSLGLLSRPGDLGADIVVAEGQCLGNPMAYGGPYLGIMACRQDFVRRLPGRIAGETVDRRQRRCWVLTLQTREQHIRRGKATSNICTNQGLLALRATIYLSLVGPQGLREIGELCLHKCRYAADRIAALPRFEMAFDLPTFKEFVVRDTAGQVPQVLQHASDAGYFAGVPLGRWYSQLDDCFLVSVTEQRTKAEIDGLADCLANCKEP